jgi:predicted ATPase
VHPLLLVLDNLHWADESSLELLTYLARHLDCQRILFVGTYRDSELAPSHRLNTLFTNLQREQVMMALPIGALTLSQIKTIAGHLTEAAVQRIQVQAAGNPLFAEALARQWSSVSRTKEGEAQLTTEPSFTHSDPTVPTVIHEALEHRLSRLSSPCQALLRRAAILGRSFQLGQVLASTSEHDEEIALDLIEEALHAGLLVEEGTGASISYRFVYPLLINHLSSSHAISTAKFGRVLDNAQ